MAEDILDIADDDSRDSFDEGSIARNRLKIDTRKWLASSQLDNFDFYNEIKFTNL